MCNGILISRTFKRHDDCFEKPKSVRNRSAIKFQCSTEMETFSASSYLEGQEIEPTVKSPPVLGTLDKKLFKMNLNW